MLMSTCSSEPYLDLYRSSRCHACREQSQARQGRSWKSRSISNEVLKSFYSSFAACAACEPVGANESNAYVEEPAL